MRPLRAGDHGDNVLLRVRGLAGGVSATTALPRALPFGSALVGGEGVDVAEHPLEVEPSGPARVLAHLGSPVATEGHEAFRKGIEAVLDEFIGEPVAERRR